MISLALSRSIFAADNRHITVSRKLHATSIQSSASFNGDTILLRCVAIGIIRGSVIAKSHCAGRLGTDLLSTGSVELHYLVSFLLLDDWRQDTLLVIALTGWHQVKRPLNINSSSFRLDSNNRLRSNNERPDDQSNQQYQASTD